jgi:hypothetical protein
VPVTQSRWPWIMRSGQVSSCSLAAVSSMARQI